jgi:CHAT domain-containing protein/tetratricopeptide (TPR) repeat protein
MVCGSSPRAAARMVFAACAVVIAPIAAKGQQSDDLDALNQQVEQLYQAGKYSEATDLAKRALAVAERRFSPDDAKVGTDLNNLALLHRAQGRYAEAEPLFKRALAIEENALGPEHPTVGTILDELAALYMDQGRYVDAEPLYERALALDEKAFGPDHPNVGRDLDNLAALYRTQGRYAEAEPLRKRALAITEKALSPEHPTVGVRLNNLAFLYRAQGRYAEAEPLFERALAIAEKALGPDHPTVGGRLSNLAGLYRDQGRYTEAEPLYKRALAIDERSLGPNHPDVGMRPLNNLALLYRDQGRYAEAEPLFKRALAIEENALGPDHPTVGTILEGLAGLYFAQSDWERAAEFGRRSTSVITLRVQRGTILGEAPTGKGKSEAARLSERFWGLVKAVYRLASKKPDETGFSREMFQTGQWAQSSEAAESLAQMAARGAKGDPKLAALVRERQDMVLEWQKRDADRSAAVAQAPDKRNREVEAENVARLTMIDARIADIDKQLAAKFPDYAMLASPAPLAVEAVQAQLASDEALVLFLDTPERNPTPEETFIWVVTKTDVRWVRSELGTPALTREVSALRCGLDYDGSAFLSGGRCSDLTYKALDHTFGKPLPFDLGRAHLLYKALFGQIEDLIRDKRLLIVPSGPLTQLPFQVLVTEAPKVSLPSSVADYRDVPWLTRKHVITVLPAVSSLKALRELEEVSHASEPYIGFGNPLLDGEPEKFKGDGPAAKLAREKQCDPTLRQRVVSLLSLRGGVRAMTRSNGGIGDVTDLRTWAPLPETADELCDVAHDLGVDPKTHLYLGATATETMVKQLSDNGSLARYKIVHFATHGAVAGDVSPASEPGLILTPPEQASETDDGYLTASEIAGLKLDADWVILSACNTAAGGAQGAEALSGLARAFFYAGARSLLVSHWAVASEPTVELITKAIAELKADPKIGRAEALRRSMLSMIDSGKDYEAHPAFWAPFVLVGEGGASR